MGHQRGVSCPKRGNGSREHPVGLDTDVGGMFTHQEFLSCLGLRDSKQEFNLESGGCYCYGLLSKYLLIMKGRFSEA